MLDTIREYGATWLDRTGETGTVADRHAAHFRGLARRAGTEWHGARQLRWYRTVDAHHTDLRTALDRLLRTDPDAALDLVGSVAFAWSCRGRLREARDGLEQALLLSGARGRVRARALWALGVTLVLQGEFGPAQDVSERCAREARHAEYADAAEHTEHTEHAEHAEHPGSAGPVDGAGRAEHGEGAGRDRPGELTLDAAALAGLLALTTGRPTAAHVVVGHVLDAARGRPADSAARLRCHLVRVFALTGLGRLAESPGAGAPAARPVRGARRALDPHRPGVPARPHRPPGGDPAAASGHARAMLEGTRRLGASLGVALGLDVLATALAAAGEASAPRTSPAPARRTGAPPASPGAACPACGPCTRSTRTPSARRSANPPTRRSSSAPSPASRRTASTAPCAAPSTPDASGPGGHARPPRPTRPDPADTRARPARLARTRRTRLNPADRDIRDTGPARGTGRHRRRHRRRDRAHPPDLPERTGTDRRGTGRRGATARGSGA